MDFLSLGVDQLLVAGCCTSADHAAHARSRNMPACMATGQAAGIAAAVAIEAGVRVRDVQVAKVQVAKVRQALRALNMPIHAEDGAARQLRAVRPASPGRPGTIPGRAG